MTQRTFWHKQTADKPLYGDMLWSRPENRLLAGKLLIIGGNAFGFAAAGEAYQQATSAGIGVARMYLPESLRKVLGRTFEAGEYGSVTPSGSFSQLALGEAIAMAHWADGVLLAGDLGRNSETAIFLEKFMNKYKGQVTITGDAADYFISSPIELTNRSGTLLVISLDQLQKLAVTAKFTTAFTSDMDLLRFIDALHEFCELHSVYIATHHLQNIFVAGGGHVSSTKLPQTTPISTVGLASRAATWWIQNPGKPFEAITTSIIAT